MLVLACGYAATGSCLRARYAMCGTELAYGATGCATSLTKAKLLPSDSVPPYPSSVPPYPISAPPYAGSVPPYASSVPHIP
eukprot:3941937-Rhodomonas_salina.3